MGWAEGEWLSGLMRRWGEGVRGGGARSCEGWSEYRGRGGHRKLGATRRICYGAGVELTTKSVIFTITSVDYIALVNRVVGGLPAILGCRHARSHVYTKSLALTQPESGRRPRPSRPSDRRRKFTIQIQVRGGARGGGGGWAGRARPRSTCRSSQAAYSL